MPGKRIGVASVVAAGTAAVYFRFLRDWQMHWGATDQESAEPLPGDDLIANADLTATRAGRNHQG